MGSFLNFVFSAILIAIWITSGGFITQANTFISRNKDKDDPENAGRFGSAWLYSFVAAFVTWTLVGIFLILIGLSVFGVVTLFGTGVGEAGLAASSVEGALLKKSTETALKKTGVSWFTILFMVGALFLVGLTGILSALTAYNLQQSNIFKSGKETDKERKAYNDAIIAASLCLGSGGLLIIGMAVYIGLSIRNKHKVQKILEENQKKREELADRLKQQEYNKLRAKQDQPPPLPPRPTSSEPPPLPPRPTTNSSPAHSSSSTPAPTPTSSHSPSSSSTTTAANATTSHNTTQATTSPKVAPINTTSTVTEKLGEIGKGLVPTDERISQAARNALINSGLSSLLSSA